MNVEIWSDIVCPWCYIGKRRFEHALDRFAHRDDVQVTWRSFELDPRSPRRSSTSLNEMLARKYGRTPAQVEAMQAQLTALAAEERLTYRLDQAQHGNTFDAHRLIHLAAQHGLQDAMKERLMQAYFTEGRPIGDPDALVAIAAEVGLDADEARAVLEGTAFASEVRADEQRAAAFGISGVPFFAIDERYGVSGAQSADVFLSALEQAWTAAHPLTMVSANGAGVCEDDNCAVPPRG